MTALLADPKLTWYLVRATGLVLLVVFTLSTALGILSVTGKAGGRVPRFVQTDLHRRLSLLSLVLLLAHILTSVLDSYVSITLVDSVVPFVGSYRPLWLGFGALALDVLLVVTVTSLLRHRLQPRLWRAVHVTSYAAWVLVVLHTLGTGTDAKRLPVLALTSVCVLTVAGLLVHRLLVLPRTGPVVRWSGLVAVPLALLLMVGWAVQGPLAPGWSHRAGTPTSGGSASGSQAQR